MMECSLCKEFPDVGLFQQGGFVSQILEFNLVHFVFLEKLCFRFWYLTVGANDLVPIPNILGSFICGHDFFSMNMHSSGAFTQNVPVFPYRFGKVMVKG